MLAIERLARRLARRLVRQIRYAGESICMDIDMCAR